VVDTQQEKYEILATSAEARQREVLNYQINIDNFTLAIAKIDLEYSDKPYMLEFSKTLSDLLQSSVVEQAKEKLMLDVIQQQLQEMG